MGCSPVVASMTMPFKGLDAQPVPPSWPPEPKNLIVEDPTYEIVQLPLSSISLVTNNMLKVCRVHETILY